MNLFKAIQEIQARNEKAVLCFIVQTSGSTPRKIGAKMLVYADGKIRGTIGGGNLEKQVIKQALVQMKLGAATTLKYNLVKDLEMCCGGQIAIYFEPIMKKNELYIFGAGHTGEALAGMAIDLGFKVSLFDDRKEYLDQINIENVNLKLINFEKDLEEISTDDHSYVAIMTYSHPIDRDILSFFADKDLAFLGMIGSKRKIEVTKKMLKEKNISTKLIDKINMPIGLNFKTDGPEEIAISILAKLIDVKNNRK